MDFGHHCFGSLVVSHLTSLIQNHSINFSGESDGRLLPRAGFSQQAGNGSSLRVNMEKLLTVLIHDSV